MSKVKSHYLRFHCAVSGVVIIDGRTGQECPRNGTEMREYEISQPKPHAQYDISVDIWYRRPKKKRREGVAVNPDNISYYTIHDDQGKLVWDSRDVVPCDMDYYNHVARDMQKRLSCDPAYNALSIPG